MGKGLSSLNEGKKTSRVKGGVKQNLSQTFVGKHDSYNVLIRIKVFAANIGIYKNAGGGKKKGEKASTVRKVAVQQMSTT